MHDPQQAERLANTYADAILRLSYTYLKSTHDAQDVCQTVFLRLLSEPRSFESPQHERAYVLRMAANACKDLLKSPWRKRSCGLVAPHRFHALLKTPRANALGGRGGVFGGPGAGGAARLCALGRGDPAGPLPGGHLSLLLRGLSGRGDRPHPGRPHRHCPHPAGPGTGKAERSVGRNGI